ncbi:NACHT domain-containing protein [Candidatus Magnetaquicoccus inordinatus]|uniref:NACHT domain-containing protein n=1 Tax=Candidatus Magnetaquicoccus inordinatus TaxID=2496818 RepID=UPI00102B5670|nr:pentapeptide repeat-containing protein [Candidatus Magnetaquicoccus inordinatus]
MKKSTPVSMGTPPPDLENMLAALLKRSGLKNLSVDGVLAMAQAGHLCLIFDGLDEKATLIGDQGANDLLKEMRRAAPPESSGKVLIACRTHFFRSHQDEQVRIKGSVRDGFRDKDIRYLYLQPFDEPRILAYLERLFPGKSDEIIALFRSVHDLQDLAKRPFLLKLLCESMDFIRRRAVPQQRITAGDIYDAIVEQWLERDQEKVGSRRYHIIPSMLRMAQLLWQQPEARINHEQLFAWQQKEVAAPGSAAEGWMQWHEEFNALLRSATFLSRDGDGNYQFAHKSFLEYFLAQAIGEELRKGNDKVLRIPALSPESGHFFLDGLAQWGATTLAAALQAILAAPYKKQISENAVQLIATWQREQPKTAPYPTLCHLEEADLRLIDLSGVQLEGVQAERANLEHANLDGARLRGSFRQAFLEWTQAADADLSECDFTDCDLSHAYFAGANLRKSCLDRAQATDTYLQRADLRGATLRNAQLIHTRLAWATWDKEALQNAQLDSVSILEGTPSSSTSCFSKPMIIFIFELNIISLSYQDDTKTITITSESGKTVKWRPGLQPSFEAEQPLPASIANKTPLTEAVNSDGTVRMEINNKCVQLFNTQTEQKMATLYASEDGRWLVLDPDDKIMACNDAGLKRVRFAHNGCLYPGTEFAGCFPDRVPEGLW